LMWHEIEIAWQYSMPEAFNWNASGHFSGSYPAPGSRAHGVRSWRVWGYQRQIACLCI